MGGLPSYGHQQLHLEFESFAVDFGRDIAIEAGEEVDDRQDGGDGGDALQAMLAGPTDVDLLPDGTLVIADKDNQCLRAVKDGKISTYAGQCGKKGYGGDGGDALKAQFNEPFGIGVGPDGTVYLADTMNHRIRAISPK